ncbi:hypothetical protein [Trichormus variabilis]|uniref:Uncharacterized protein n=1 Tax=Trichormus variabilis SAG 1403-4b TaxID=447716 RepID=A0A3S1ARG3_ANAVA|nr:hypothetical protein [Trichormus variabilis]MBD2627640.1 hypothetical protein [Trichormus variabilis FACHB-164]RUS97870.1 hypothetical protein DSM107003_17450 [Trichormus variabilis SAG 1403-4b]
MTSRADEIHKLIADIDNLLAHSGNRLSKLLSGQGPEDREVLHRVRDFLVKLTETEVSEDSTPNQSTAQPLSTLLARFVEQENNQPASHSYQTQQEPSNVVAGQLKDELLVLFEPLQAELSGLLQERATLVQEIRQLEQKRLQNYSLTQQLANQEQIIAEFLQVLISRLIPSLTPHLKQTGSNPPSSVTDDQNQNLELVNAAMPSGLESAEGIDRLASLARELDQRLLSLDGTVNVVFGSLERNINTYHQSLSQALAKMHSQGMQGEQLMVNFLNNLTQYLQQQSLDTQPLFSAVNTELEVQPVSTSSEVVSQPLPLIQLEDDSSPHPASAIEDAVTVENVDAVLSYLVSDEFLASNLAVTTSEELQSEGVEENLEAALLEITTDDSAALPTSQELQSEAVEENLEAALLEITTDDSAALPTPQELQSEAVEEALEAALLEITTDDSVAFLTSSELQSEGVEENLEAILAEIATDDSFSHDSVALPTPEQLQSQTPNAVDQLYASLFGSENSTVSKESIALPMITPELSVTEITPSPTISEQEEDDLLVFPDHGVEQQEANIFEPSHNPVTELSNALIESTEPSSELWEGLLLTEDTQPEVEVTIEDTVPTLLDSLPDPTDTITVLTDLLVDASSDQQLLEILSFDDNLEIAAAETLIVSSPREVQTEAQDLLVSTYIAASPQENLLSLENNEAQIVPDIVLDEEQLQQLNRDLANFDWQLNSGSESLNNSESFPNSLDTVETITETPISQPVENIPTVAVSDLDVRQLDIGVDLNQTTEKKKEATIFFQDASLPTSNNLSATSEATVTSLDSIWYLGIDLGTTGISAALLNRSRSIVYPVYWSAQTQLGETAFEQSFRLPAEVYLPTASIPHAETIEQTTPAAVAKDKVSDNLTQNSPLHGSPEEPKHHLYSTHLKPYLHVAIPYKNTQQKWEPVLQLNEFSAGPLIWVVRSLSKLLLTLKSDQSSTTPALIAQAVGIDTQTFSHIINNLAGVVCTCPSNWLEQYRFNVREAILTSKLVSHAQQVFFVEEAIASLLPELDSADSQPVQLSENQGLRPLKTSENPMQGNTLALNIGATSTEMALVDLPSDLSQLTYRDFMLHSFAYAGKGIEQDIICQLLLPPKSRQPRQQSQANSNTATSNSTQRHWQPSIPGLDQMHLSSLGLEALELPRVGEPDIAARIRFQQRLESSLLGQGLLEAATALKLILQHQESFTLELADGLWVLQRRDLESQVFVPFVRRLNRELNKLLVARGIPTEAVNQAILSGGVASVGTVNRWLRQKLPNAKIIQDLYLGENGAPNSSRVAYGLAMLPLYHQVLEIPRQQYTDYFLFTELLRLLPDSSRGNVPEASTIRSLSFGEVLQLFESRGINTRTCQQRLLAFLEGELPPGLIPSILSERLPHSDAREMPLDSIWLTKNSQENLDYQAIAAAPLFEKQGNLTYRPNSQQLLSLRRYLDAIKASSLQSLEEPYTVNFSFTVNPQH